MLDGLADIQSVAVIGASPRSELARAALENLVRFGPQTRVYAVHPAAIPPPGAIAAHSLAELPEIPDLCLLLIGTKKLVGVIEEAAERGVQRFVIPGGGSNEGGEAIKVELHELIKRRSLSVIGPNCMGMVSFSTGIAPYIGWIAPGINHGVVGIASQSGSVCELCTALEWRVGFSHILSVGNELGTDLSDGLAFMAGDPNTLAIGLFVEGVRRPVEFRRGLEAAASQGKPVVVLKAGRSKIGAAGALAHSGSMAVDAEVFSAVLRSANAIEVRDVEELLTVLELLGKGVSRAPDRVVLVGDSGGEANLFADLAADRGIELPRLTDQTCSDLNRQFPTLGHASNPLDLWALGPPEDTYSLGVGLLLQSEPHLVVIGLDKHLTGSAAGGKLVNSALAGVTASGSALLMAFGGADVTDASVLKQCWKLGVPVTRGATTTVSALAALGRWRSCAKTQPNQELTVRAVDGIAAAITTFADGDIAWSEWASKRLLECVHISLPEETQVFKVSEATEASQRLGYPVVIKASAPNLPHKTEQSGVRLNLMSQAEVAKAARDLLAAFGSVIVARQYKAEMELIISAFNDPTFGPCCLVGLGGTWAEKLSNHVVVASPSSHSDVRLGLSMRPWGRLLLDGARGRTFATNAVIRTVLGVLDLLSSTVDHIAAIEINPLFVQATSAVAIDALVVPKRN
jgi:acyl-CoA synthetase (NDP forming)